MEQFKRKNFIIDRRFQYGLIATFLISILVSLVLFTGVITLYYWFSSMAGDNVFKEFITIEQQVTEQREIVEEGELKVESYTTTKTIPGVKRWEIVVPAILINNLVIMIVIIILGIFYSHRIAGPTYRMIVDIQRVLDGETGVRVRLRRKDKLHELADRINLLVEKVENLRED